MRVGFLLKVFCVDIARGAAECGVMALMTFFRTSREMAATAGLENAFILIISRLRFSF